MRPLVVLYSSTASFHERLFVRGLVSTLLAHGRPLPLPEAPKGGRPEAGGPEAGGAGAGALGPWAGWVLGGASPTRAAQDLVWWDVLQPRLAMRDRQLSRCGSSTYHILFEIFS